MFFVTLTTELICIGVSCCVSVIHQNFEKHNFNSKIQNVRHCSSRHHTFKEMIRQTNKVSSKKIRYMTKPSWYKERDL